MSIGTRSGSWWLSASVTRSRDVSWSFKANPPATWLPDRSIGWGVSCCSYLGLRAASADLLGAPGSARWLQLLSAAFQFPAPRPRARGGGAGETPRGGHPCAPPPP